jgi:hypothetical protein
MFLEAIICVTSPAEEVRIVQETAFVSTGNAVDAIPGMFSGRIYSVTRRVAGTIRTAPVTAPVSMGNVTAEVQVLSHTLFPCHTSRICYTSTLSEHSKKKIKIYSESE